MKRIYVWALLMCTAVSAIAQESFPINGIRDIRTGLYAFTNATIIQNEKTKLEKATLLIKQGKIIAVGTSVAIPKDAVVVNCEGKFIYPSLWTPLPTMVRLKQKDQRALSTMEVLDNFYLISQVLITESSH